MATFQYADLYFSEVLSASVEQHPETDPSGMDHECTRIRLTIVAPCNPFWATTNKPDGGRGAASRGDRLGIALYQIRSILNEPRGVLRYVVGNDVVVESPARKDPDGAQFYASDIGGGPKPISVNISEIAGAKTAILKFVVDTWVNIAPNNQILLSNRWEWSGSVSNEGMASATITGRARFRKDMLVHNSLVPDDFRSVIIPQPDRNMRRVKVDVKQDAAAATLHYAVHDRAVMYAIPGIVRMDCHVTAGISASASAAGSLAATTARTLSLGKHIVTRDVAGLAHTFAGVLNNRLSPSGAAPQAFVSATARAQGAPATGREHLVRACLQMIFSRVSVGMHLCSAQISTDWSSESAPLAEMSCEFMLPWEFREGAWIAGRMPQGLYFGTDAGLDRARNHGLVMADGDGTPLLDLQGGAKPGVDVGPVQPQANATRGQRAGRAFAQYLADHGLLGAQRQPTAPTVPGEGDRNLAPIDRNVA